MPNNKFHDNELTINNNVKYTIKINNNQEWATQTKNCRKKTEHLLECFYSITMMKDTIFCLLGYPTTSGDYCPTSALNIVAWTRTMALLNVMTLHSHWSHSQTCSLVDIRSLIADHSLIMQ